jgi:hypothetical protein
MSRSHRFLIECIVFLIEGPSLDAELWGESSSRDSDIWEPEELYELICLGSIGDRKIRDLVDTSKYTCMESHPDNHMEKRIEIECLFDIFGSIAWSVSHDTSDISDIILGGLPFGRKYEKYRLVAIRHEHIIQR